MVERKVKDELTNMIRYSRETELVEWVWQIVATRKNRDIRV